MLSLRLLLSLCTVQFLALNFLAISSIQADEDKRPNIIFIFTDDHAPHAIGAYGSKINKTPNMDRLAREGMIFKNSFCTNSICGPSRAVILTGKHSHLNGFRTNTDRFDGSQQTFPKLLQKVGYQTAMIGKWHLKSDPTGFDFWEVLLGQGPYYNPPLKSAAGVRNTTGYTTEILTDVALDWLKTKRDPKKPFMMMYQHKAPHREWAPGPKYLTMFDDVKIPEPPTLFDDYKGRTSATLTQTMTLDRHFSARDMKLVAPRNLTPEQLKLWNAAYGPKNEAFKKANLTGKDLIRWKYQRYIKDYLRCIASVDDNIGRVLKYLEENDLEKNTIVIYSSDQGFYLGDHGWYDKRWMYEESLKMPLIVKWPGVVKPGSVNEHLVQNLDYAETFLEIAGAKIPADMQGRSLVPLLKGEDPADWRKSIYYHYYEFPGAHMVRRHFGVRTERYKLIHYYNIHEWEFFDLQKDPDELRSLYDQRNMQPMIQELHREMKRLQRLYKDDEPTATLASLSQRRIRRQAGKVKQALSFHLHSGSDKFKADLDPAAKPITVGAVCNPKAGDGVIVAQGGISMGYTLYLKGGKPTFGIRSSGTLVEVSAEKAISLNEASHIVGVLTPRGKLRLYVKGQLVAEDEGQFIINKPADGLSVGNDTGSFVGEYTEEKPFQGTLSDIRIYWGILRPKQIKNWAAGNLKVPQKEEV